MLVGQILASKGSEVFSTQPEAPVADVATLLKEKGIGAVVVMQPGGGIAGIISERDLARGLADHGPSLFEKRVADLMTAEVVTCAPDDAIEKLMSDMTGGRFRHVPVIEGNTVIGVISIGDVVKYRLQELEATTQQLQGYIAGVA